MPRVVHILGAGIIGLSTSITLQQAGFQVIITTKALPRKTTSAKAGALWFPFRVLPVELVNQWSLTTYFRYKKLAQEKHSGVAFVDFLKLVTADDPLEWKTALPPGILRKARADELPTGPYSGFVANVPFITPSVHLDFLLLQFYRLGGKMILKEVDNLHNFCQNKSLVINCTGLGAKELTGDPKLYPIQGHLARYAYQDHLPYLVDDTRPEKLAYIFPRQGDIVLGGTTVPHSYDTKVSNDVIADIKKRCSHLAPAVKSLTLLEATVGLRPARSAIRLEREDKQLIHNYGHGGGGYTVCWGCAEAVLEIIKM